MTATESFAVPPAQQTFTLSLDKVHTGVAPNFLPLNVEFAYNWEWNRNVGNATVLNVGGTKTEESMFPMGISKKFNFMSKERFSIKLPNGEDLYSYRVILNMDRETATERSAAMMLGEEGDIIITTANWNKPAEEKIEFDVDVDNFGAVDIL